MGNGELTLVTTINEFMEWAAQFNQGGYLFRGVTNEDYDISASTYRRLIDRDESPEGRVVNFEKFVQINRGLVRDIRLRDLDWKNGRKMRDLEILAELQHFRAATCLIDFTYNVLIALWFACYPDSANATRCGKVVAVRVDQGHKFRDVTLELLEKDIDYFFLGNEEEIHQQLYKWQPSHQNSRIIVQQSIFLFGAVEIDPDQRCIILGSKKNEIRAALQQVHGISERMLFPDFEGFARGHRQDVVYIQLAASQYRTRAHQKQEKHEYEKAIAAFTKAIELNPGKSSDYQYRGLTWEMLLNSLGTPLTSKYEQINADYTEAINLDPNAPYVYFLRGRLRKMTGRKYEAVLDLEKALPMAQALGGQEYITQIESLLHQLNPNNGDTSEDE